MDKPNQPSKDLIDLVHCGNLWAIEYDKDLSDESRAEAESACHHEGRFEWDAILRVKGRVSGKQLCDPQETTTFIRESTFIKYVEVHDDPNHWGFWQVTHEGRVTVELWEKWLKKEAKDLSEYKRLKKKFRGL